MTKVVAWNCAKKMSDPFTIDENLLEARLLFFQRDPLNVRYSIPREIMIDLEGQ